MTPEERPAEDPLLARVAAARPALREDDLSPSGERATAILERVLDSRPPSAQARPRRSAWSSRLRPRRPAAFGTLGGLALAAVAALVFVFAGDSGPRRSRAAHPLPSIGTHPLPASDAIHLDSTPFIPHAQLVILLKTPLGRAMVQQYRLTQENIDTGDAAQNLRAIQQLQFNQAACLHAAVMVAAAPVTPAQRYIQYDWVHGIRLQARMDGLFITALRDFTAGHRAAGRRAENAAGNLSNISIAFTAYPLDRLGGDELPLPSARGIEGPGGVRRR